MPNPQSAIRAPQSGSLFSEPGVLTSVARPTRGRGATEILRFSHTLDKPNPAGRRALSFRFRPLKRCSKARLIAVCGSNNDPSAGLLLRYFAKVGGFRLATDAIVRVWCDALRLDDEPEFTAVAQRLAFGAERIIAQYSVAEFRWAIDAKAASLHSDDPDERRTKRKFVGAPETFVERALPVWLERSDEYQRLVKRRADKRFRERLDQVKVGDRPPIGNRPPDGQSEARRRLAWECLSAVQRRAARLAVKQAFEQQLRGQGANPEDPAHDELYTAMATNWAADKWPERFERRGTESTEHTEKDQ